MTGTTELWCSSSHLAWVRTRSPTAPSPVFRTKCFWMSRTAPDEPCCISTVKSFTDLPHVRQVRHGAVEVPPLDADECGPRVTVLVENVDALLQLGGRLDTEPVSQLLRRIAEDVVLVVVQRVEEADDTCGE